MIRTRYFTTQNMKTAIMGVHKSAKGHAFGQDTIHEHDTVLSQWVSLFLALLIPSLIAFHPLGNNDLPMHLAVGGWILENESVPKIDPFSANGHGESWVAHEWLAAVIFKQTELLGEATGLILITMIFSATLGVLLELIYRSLQIPVFYRLLLAIPLWLTVGRRLMLRPHLLALNCVLLVWYLTRRGRQNPMWLWLLIPVMCLWSNLHGSFLLGLAYIIGDLCLFHRGHLVSRKRLSVIAATSCLVTLINPHGWVLYSFPFKLALDPTFTSQVVEWMSPLKAPMFLHSATAISGIFLALFFITTLLISIRKSKGHFFAEVNSGHALFLPILATVIALILASQQIRHFALAALLATPVSLALLNETYPLKATLRLRGWKWALVGPLLLVLMLSMKGYPAHRNEQNEWMWRSSGTGWSSLTPMEPVSALFDSWQVKGVVLCEYEFGGFISYISRGECQPTMDSRNTVYTPGSFLDHEKALRGNSPATLNRLLQISNAVLINPNKDRRNSLIQILNEDDDKWALISVGTSAQLWVRRSAVPERFRSSLPPTRG